MKINTMFNNIQIFKKLNNKVAHDEVAQSKNKSKSVTKSKLLCVKNSILPVLLCVTILGMFAGCDEGTVSGKDSGGSYLKGIKVKVAGTVKSSDTGTALEGMKVAIKQVVKDADDATVGTEMTTDSNGQFAATDYVTLTTDKYQYYLYVTDPNKRYYDHDSYVIYAVTISDLTFNDIKMVSKYPRTLTTVKGVVLDAKTNAVISGVTLSLLKNSTDTDAVATATSDSSGAFSMSNVWVDNYSLKIDGDAQGYIIETQAITLETSQENDLKSINLMTKSSTQDLSMILTWKYDTAPTFKKINLDANFSLANATFDFNHLMGQQSQIQDSSKTITPGSGFARKTSYWPAFLGGSDTNREFIGDTFGGTRTYTVSSSTVVSLTADSTGGLNTTNDLDVTGNLKPEVLTFNQKKPLSTDPTNLGYYYTVGSTQYYPVGMGVYTVSLNTSNSQNLNIYDSEAKVKVYIGSSYLGTFSISDLTVPPGEGNKTYWTPIIVEYGYTASSPTTDSQVYFRPLPLSSFNRDLYPEKWAYSVTGVASGASQMLKAYTAIEDYGMLLVGGMGNGTGSLDYGIWEFDGYTWTWYADGTFSREFQCLSFTTFEGFPYCGGTNNNNTSQNVKDIANISYTSTAATAVATLDDVFYVGTASGGLYSNDLAGTETAIGSWPGAATMVNVFYKHEFYDSGSYTTLLLAGTNDGLKASVEGTHNWGTTLPGSSPIATGTSVTALSSFDDDLYVGTNGSGIYTCSYADDTWTQISSTNFSGTGKTVTAFAVYDDILFIGTTAGIWVYDKWGETGSQWRQFTFPAIQVNGFYEYNGSLYVLTESGLAVLK